MHSQQSIEITSTRLYRDSGGLLACRGLVPHDVANLGGWQLDAPALSQLSLSPDETILAAAADDVIRVFVVADLVCGPGQQPQTSLPPATSWHLPSGATAVQVGDGIKTELTLREKSNVLNIASFLS